MDELFNHISTRNKEKLMQMLEPIVFEYKKNSVIELEEKMVCVVVSGAIQIIKNDYNGNSYLVEEYEENEIFDSISQPILHDEYVMIAKNDTKVIMIEFDNIVSESTINTASYNHFLKNLLKIMDKNITKRNERIEILVNKTIRNKLLAYFKLMSKKYNSKVFLLNMTFTELADYLAVDRSSMNRELRYLKDEGLIRVSKRKIVLLYEL